MRTRRSTRNETTESTPVASETPTKESSPFPMFSPIQKKSLTNNETIKENGKVPSFSIVTRRARRSETVASCSDNGKHETELQSFKKEESFNVSSDDQTSKENVATKTNHTKSTLPITKKADDPTHKDEEEEPSNTKMTQARSEAMSSSQENSVSIQEEKEADEEPPPLRKRTRPERPPRTTTTTAVRKQDPNDLEENTLQRVKEYLKQWKNEQVLDEDEVVELTERLYTAAHQHALQRRNAGLSKGATPSDESEAEYDDASLFEACLEEEETHVIGHEFFNEMVEALSTPGDDGTTPVLDGKTLTWIKRAVGLRRRKSQTADRTLNASSRRMTTRCLGRPRKRPRGLDVLAAAVDELEEDWGVTFPRNKIRKSTAVPKKGRHLKNGKSDSMASKGNPVVKKKQRKLDQRSKLSTSKKSNQRTKGDKKQLHRGKRTAKKAFCTSLRGMDWVWRQLLEQQYPHVIPPLQQRSETEAEFRIRQAIPLHPRFIQAGIIHRLPLMRNLSQNHNVLNVPELDGLTRRFAQCEFFYSDLDKEW